MTERRSVFQITELRSLLPGWDSYGAAIVNHKAAVNAVRLFGQIMYDETPAPQVVPTNAGKIQLEWHVHGIDLEIEISGDGSVHCYFADDGKHEQQFDEGEAFLFRRDNFWFDDFSFFV